MAPTARTKAERTRSRRSALRAMPRSAIAVLSTVAGIVLGFWLAPGRNPEIGAGLVIVMGLVIAVVAMRLLQRPAERRLTASEASRSAYFDHAIEGIFRTTLDGRYLDANPALARIYGYPDAQALMVGLTDIAGQLYVDTGRRPAFQALLRENDVVTDFVSEIRRRDGTKIWISENARAVRNWGGQVVFYEGTVEDVTSQVEAQEAMRDALRQTEEASRAKSAFLAAMSHELKTPLNAVLGFSEMLKQEQLGPIGNKAYRGYAADIHESGMRLLAIINDILDAARLQAGSVSLDRRDVMLASVVEEALAAARRSTGDNRPVEIDVPENFPLVRVDPEWLARALIKLLSNAFKFTLLGGAIILTARVAREGAVTLAVRDEGIGMEPEKIALALEPFSQIDRSLARRFEGAGLGLSIARALAELHGGALSIASEKGHGTTVTITLPADAVASDRAEHSPGRRAAG